MPYNYFLTILLLLFVTTFLWLYIVDKDSSFFKKSNLKLFLMVFMISSILGSGRLLAKKPIELPASSYMYFISVIFLVLGILLVKLLDSKFSWAWADKRNFRMVLPILGVFGAFAATVYFVFAWMLEVPFFKSAEGFSDNYAVSMLIAYVPFSIIVAHHYWNKIPVLHNELVPWVPDITANPYKIEPDKNGLRFSIQLPLRHGNIKNIETLSVLAPRENSLDQIFYNAIIEYNSRVFYHNKPKIEVCVDESKVYGWVFFKLKKSWWRAKRVYLNPFEPLKSGYVLPQETIYADRIKAWKS